MKSSTNLIFVHCPPQTVLISGGRMKQIFWQSSTVELKNLKSLRKPLQMSYSWPTR